jgi:hypothetical protein
MVAVGEEHKFEGFELVDAPASLPGQKVQSLRRFTMSERRIHTG